MMRGNSWGVRFHAKPEHHRGDEPPEPEGGYLVADQSWSKTWALNWRDKGRERFGNGTLVRVEIRELPPKKRKTR